jgi:class 3 adenylate cyclase
VVATTARFCEQCGARLPPEPIAPPASGMAGDRRVVTALFADLVDYVRLVAEHDPEVVRRRVGAALATMSEAIDGFDGTREKFIGDAVFAVFGWPRAHDDDALRATHCALAIRDRLARLEDPELDALQVRIGLATGEVVAAPRGVPGDMGWSLTGPAITTAARIQGLAEPGEILLDEPTRRATRKRLTIEDLGERILRGQRRPVRLGRLLGDTGFQPWHPPSGRFIGRVPQRDALLGLVGGSRGTGSAGSPSSPATPGSASRVCWRTWRPTSGGPVSAGPGSTTSRTASRIHTGSAARSPRPSPRSTGRIRGHSRGGSCSRATSRRTTSASGPGRSPPSRATPPSRGGRRRRTSCRPTRSSSPRPSGRCRARTWNISSISTGRGSS